MKKISLLIVLLFFNSIYSQLIVNNTSITPAQLVQNVLLGAGVSASNIKFNGSLVSANLIRDQAGQFSGTSNIGLAGGIILSTGNSQVAVGPNNNGGLGVTSFTPIFADSDLQLLTTNVVNNAAILEFDFIPQGQNLSFDFVFASEEYPEYALSQYNDVFGFFLSGPGITGPFSGGARNIALIPTTTLPVSINNVNSTTNNTYYISNGTGTTPTSNPTIQYDGFTTVIPAQATVQCGLTYHIKLAIANVSDNFLDSAVFLKANSFNSIPVSYPADLTVLNGTAPCYGTSGTITTGFAATVLHEWFFNGTLIPGETSPVLNVTQAGNYCYNAFPYGIGCPINHCVTVQYLPQLILNSPLPISSCGTFDLTSNSLVVLNGASPSDFTVSYHTTAAAAQNGTAGPKINNPTVYPGTNGQQIWASVESVSTPCLYVVGPFTLNYNPSACICETITSPSPSQNLCSTSGDPTPFTTNTSFVGTNAISYVYFTTPQTGAAMYTGGTLLGNVTPAAGVASYDAPLLGTAGSLPNVVATYYVYAIANPTPTIVGCRPFQEIQVVVNQGTTINLSSVAGSNNQSFCFGSPLNTPIVYTIANGGTGASVSGLPAGLTTTFNSGTFTISGTPSAAGTFNYTVSTSGGCGTATALGTITVSPLPTATISPTTLTEVCQGGAAPSITFTGANGTAPYKFTYTINGGTPIVSAPSTGNVFTLNASTAASGTFIYTLVSVQDASASTCSQNQTGSSTVKVNALPTATASASVTAVCQGGTAPQVTFTGANGTAPYKFTYTINGGTPIVSPPSTGNVFTVNAPTTASGSFVYALVSVQDASTTTCSGASTSSVTITVNSLPTATVITSSTVGCKNGSTVPIVTFTGANGTAPYKFTYTTSFNGATPITSTTVPSTGNAVALNVPNTVVGMYVYTLLSVVDASATNCSQNQSGSVSIDIKDSPTVSFASNAISICQNSSTLLTALPSPAVAIGTYSYTWTVPTGSTNPGNVASFTTSTNDTAAGNYSVIVTDSSLSQCPSQPASVALTLVPLPTASLQQNGYICVDANGSTINGSTFLLTTGLSAANYTFDWKKDGVSTGQTGSSYTANAPGLYSVVITTTTTPACSNSTPITATIAGSSPPASVTLTSSNYFQDNQTITVEALPVSNYEYQIDNGIFQDSNLFSNLNSGNHTVVVRDKKLCGITTNSTETIDYPHFFTPNGDGYNDYWNITDLKSTQSEVSITIFDRFGKLIKQISVASQGWDGTFNGAELPATDYWFSIDYTEKSVKKQFKSHFSLKR